MRDKIRTLIVLLPTLAACAVGSADGVDFGTSAGSEDPGESGSDETESTGGDEAPPPAVEGAYRVTSLSLADPHTYMAVGDEGCDDVTSLLEATGLQGPIDDGEIDMVIRLSRDEDTLSATMFTGSCDAGTCSPSSEGDGTDPQDADFQASKACDVVDAAMFNDAYGTVPASEAPCVSAATAPIELDVGAETPILARDAKWSASVADQSMTQGVLRVFVTKADAEATELGLDEEDDSNLWSLIAGGDACMSDYDDTDEHPDHGVGVWLHFEFSTEPVDWVD